MELHVRGVSRTYRWLKVHSVPPARPRTPCCKGSAPALIDDAGHSASLRLLEFFTVNMQASDFGR